MARLTKYTREIIVEGALEHRFTAEREALADKYAVFALEVYHTHYRPDDVRQMRKLPAGWLVERSYIRAKIAGDYSVLRFSGSQARGRANVHGRPCVNLRMFAEDSVVVIDGGTPLADQWAQLCNEETNLCSAITAAKAATEQLLSKIFTTEKLAEVWPEGVQFLPPEQAPVNLPALPVGDVNKMLGLS